MRATQGPVWLAGGGCQGTQTQEMSTAHVPRASRETGLRMPTLSPAHGLAMRGFGVGGQVPWPWLTWSSWTNRGRVCVHSFFLN